MSDARPDHVGLLAAELRERLIEQRRALAVAGSSEVPDLPVAIAELVAAEAALLSETGRERGRRSGAARDRRARAARGAAPATPTSRRCSSTGTRRCGSSAAAASSVPPSASTTRRRCATSSSGSSGRSGAGSTSSARWRTAGCADGSRVNVVIPPLSVDGPAVSIRRFAGIRPDPDELVARDSFDAELRDLLAEAVGARRKSDHQRRHRLGQDDRPQRALVVHRPGRAGDHDRGRCRAPARPAARGPAREPPARASRARAR